MSSDEREPTPKLLDHLKNLDLLDYADNFKQFGFCSTEIIACLPKDEDANFVSELRVQNAAHRIKLRTMINKIRKEKASAILPIEPKVEKVDPTEINMDGINGNVGNEKYYRQMCSKWFVYYSVTRC